MKKMNVGVALQGDPQNGITLIALIITIIVMLILVGVTINVSLNGGLVEKAKVAQTQTSREVSREQIVSAMIGAYDNNGNFVKANVELPEGANWCTKDGALTTEGNYVKTEKGEIFYVDPDDGTVLDEEPQAKAYSFTINGLKQKGLEPVFEEGDSVLIYVLDDFKEVIGEEPFKDQAYIYAEAGLYKIKTNNEKIGCAVDFFVYGNSTGKEEMFVTAQVDSNAFILIFNGSGDGDLIWSSADYEKFVEDYGNTVFTFVK